MTNESLTLRPHQRLTTGLFDVDLSLEFVPSGPFVPIPFIFLKNSTQPVFFQSSCSRLLRSRIRYKSKTIGSPNPNTYKYTYFMLVQAECHSEKKCKKRFFCNYVSSTKHRKKSSGFCQKCAKRNQACTTNQECCSSKYHCKQVQGSASSFKFLKRVRELAYLILKNKKPKRLKQLDRKSTIFKSL